MQPRFVPETVVAAASSAHGLVAHGTPIVAGDIRFEGLHRVEPDTALAHLPVHMGDTLTDETASEFSWARYITGFSEDARITMNGDATTPHADSAGPARFSPIGPFRSSRGFPHKKHNGDQYQNFRFQPGTAF